MESIRRQNPQAALMSLEAAAASAHGGFAAIVKKPSDPTYLCRVVADVIKGPAR